MNLMSVLPPVFNSGGSSDQHVTCHMCLSRFSYPSRLPLSLQCLHTFCSHCVFGWTCNKTKQKLPCPICGKVTKLDKGRRVQECLPVNHAVLELATMSEPVQNGYMNGIMSHGQFVDYCPPQPSQYAHSGVIQQGPLAQVPTPQISTTHCDVGYDNSAVQHSKMYPDLPSGKESIRIGYKEPPRMPLKPVEINCDCKCEKKINSCGNECHKCDNSKPQPSLQINIGSMKFRKLDPYVEEDKPQMRGSPIFTEGARPGAVTEVSVNSSPKITRRMPEVPRTAVIAKISSDKCVRCNVNPATVTVTHSADKSVQRLCSQCHEALKEEKRNEEREVRPDCRRETNDVPNNARTVIKVQSKLNEEPVRCSPVSEPRSRQPYTEKMEMSNGFSVLKLGDNVRSASPAVACSNQVVCGPFKSTDQEKKEVNAGVTYSEVVRVANHRNGEERNRTTEPTAVRVDIGTVDSQRIKRTSNTVEEIREVRVRQIVPEPISRPAPQRRQQPQIQQHQRPNRHREYMVRADGEREAVISAEEMNRPLAFNPQYNELNDLDTQSVSDLGLPTVEPVNFLQRATTKEQEAMSYSNNNNVGSYPTLSAPPRYEEIMGEASKKGGAGPGGPVLKFGRYGENGTQPGALRNPTGINVAHDGRVSVVDASNRTVQVFDPHSGECIQLLNIEGVTASCHARDGSLVAGTSKGVDVYKPNGAPSKKVDMGHVVALAAYRNGFVAAQARALIAFKDLGGTSKTISEIVAPNKYPQTKTFQNIVDVAVNSQQDFIVLDADHIFILGDEGNIKGALKPHQQPCGPLRGASSVGVDERGNILVCDMGSGRVLLFGTRGQFIGDIVQNVDLRARPIGLGVGRHDRAYVAVRGERVAEILSIKYQ